MSTQALAGGFIDPATQAALGFRAIMTAMAQPGTICDVTGASGPAPLSDAAAVVLLTLCDGDTGLYLAPSYDTTDMRAWIGFHLGAPIVSPEQASFALGAWHELLPLDTYRIGTPDYPDRSATLIVECLDLSTAGATLRGPGIKDSATLALPDVDLIRANQALFPLGLDFIFTAGTQTAALPRSTRIS